MRTEYLMLKKPFVFFIKNLLHNELDKSSVCANENEPQTVNGPVVVKLTTIRFTGTTSTKNRNFRDCTHPVGLDSCSTRHRYQLHNWYGKRVHGRAQSRQGTSSVRCQQCRPDPANQLQIHATKYEVPGPLTVATILQWGNRRYFN